MKGTILTCLMEGGRFGLSAIQVDAPHMRYAVVFLQRQATYAVAHPFRRGRAGKARLPEPRPLFGHSCIQLGKRIVAKLVGALCWDRLRLFAGSVPGFHSGLRSWIRSLGIARCRRLRII